MNRDSTHEMGVFSGSQSDLQEIKRYVNLKELKRRKRGLIIVLFECFEVKFLSAFSRTTRESTIFYATSNRVNGPSYSCKFVSIRG